jgi:hypothetical protein
MTETRETSRSRSGRSRSPSSSRGGSRKRSRRRQNRARRRVLWTVLSVLALLVFAAVWVGVRGLMAKDALDQAVPAASALAKQISTGDREGADQSYRTLQSNASDAAALTSDPVWRAVEIIPVLGVNLTAVREAAGIVDDVSRNAIARIVGVSATVGVGEFAPVNGAVQLQPLIDAQPGLAAAAVVVDSADRRAQAIDTDATIGLVTKAVTKLQDTLSEATVVVDTVDRAATLLPSMMGASGDRNYLLLFQNPAELRATGGIPGAVAQLTVSGGAISLTQQASSGDFPMAPSPVAELPLETRALYGDITGQYIQDVNLTPQFPISATLAAEMWRQRFGVQVDGVMSVDPVALSYLLRATGPITLQTGDVLTSDNAVKLLLTDVYSRYPDTRAQDAFFAAAASAVFNAVATGAADPSKMLDALTQAGDEHRLLVWSANPGEQAELAETTIAGALPVSDAKTDRIGVYLNDATGSKMGTHLQTKIDTGRKVCRADGLPQSDVQITLTNTAPADAATSLPEYVTAGGAYGVTPGNIKLIVNIYGVPGSANLGLTRDGVEFAHHSTTDSGYPVSAVEVELAPGQSTTLVSSFLSSERNNARIVIQKTPEVNISPIGEVDLIC